jgi:hypothetical protein
MTSYLFVIFHIGFTAIQAHQSDPVDLLSSNWKQIGKNTNNCTIEYDIKYHYTHSISKNLAAVLTKRGIQFISKDDNHIETFKDNCSLYRQGNRWKLTKSGFNYAPLQRVKVDANDLFIYDGSSMYIRKTRSEITTPNVTIQPEQSWIDLNYYLSGPIVTMLFGEGPGRYNLKNFEAVPGNVNGIVTLYLYSNETKESTTIQFRQSTGSVVKISETKGGQPTWQTVFGEELIDQSGIPKSWKETFYFEGRYDFSKEYTIKRINLDFKDLSAFVTPANASGDVIFRKSDKSYSAVNKSGDEIAITDRGMVHNLQSIVNAETPYISKNTLPYISIVLVAVSLTIFACYKKYFSLQPVTLKPKE